MVDQSDFFLEVFAISMMFRSKMEGILFFPCFPTKWNESVSMIIKCFLQHSHTPLWPCHPQFFFSYKIHKSCRNQCDKQHGTINKAKEGSSEHKRNKGITFSDLLQFSIKFIESPHHFILKSFSRHVPICSP